MCVMCEITSGWLSAGDQRQHSVVIITTHSSPAHCCPPPWEESSTATIAGADLVDTTFTAAATAAAAAAAAATAAAAAAGGPSGFHTRVFKVTSRDFSDKGSAVTLTYSSSDGEEVRREAQRGQRGEGGSMRREQGGG